jgi:FAD/FMN-containing dehydrogenase
LAVRDLQALVRGRVWSPADASYEPARTAVWCANVPARFPAAILRAASAKDVIAAVRFAKANGLRIAVRGGGHNWSAASLREGAILIDLGGLAELTIDPAARRATVQPGVSGGALVAEAMAAGLMFPIAHCPSVPMSGFLLNGGYGFNAGEWGPSVLLVEAMEIVTADGELVRASETENSELFWAARGAGPGFFGIVTRFHLRLLPPRRSILATNYIFPLEATAEATDALHRIRADCPDNVELTFLASAGAGPPQAPKIGVVSGIAFADDEELARRSLDFLDDFPARGAAMVVENRVPMTWPSLFEAVGALFPPKMHYLGNTIWTSVAVSDLYAPYAEHLATAPSPYAFSNCVLYPPGFAEKARHYDAALSMQSDILSLQYAIWDDPAESARNEEWFRQSAAIFQPHAQGHYIGEADLNLFPQFARGSYSRETWSRLVSLRKRSDPSGVFFDFLGHDRGPA